MNMFRLFLACAAVNLALVASSAEIAVLQNGRGKHAGEFATAFAELGWEPTVFPDTKEGMAEFAADSDRFDLVLMAPLFLYQAPETDLDVTALKTWIEKGGVLVVTDASYGGPRALLEKMDKCLGGLETGKCTSSQWAVLGYTANVEPVHPMRAFPNALTDGDSWPHFEEPSEGSPWKVVTRCSEGKPVILYTELGKGAILLSSLRQQAAKAIENYYAYSQLKKSGLTVKDFKLTDLKPGKGCLEISLVREPPAGTKVIYEIAELEGRRPKKLAFTAAFEGLSAAADFNVSVRGKVAVTIFIKTPGDKRVISRRVATLPNLLEIGPNAYRGILSTKRRTPNVKFPVRFAPDFEDLTGGKLVFGVFDAISNQVSAAEFELPTNEVPAEIWYSIPLDQKLGAGGYRIDVALSKKGTKAAKAISAKASAAFEIIAPREAQTVIDEDGTFLVNGKPFFPLGIYHIGPNFFETAKDIGFNTIQFWSWHGGGDEWGVPTAMYRAMGNGLRCLFESNHSGEKVYLDQIKRYADNPALLMWYIADEPNEGQAKELRDRNEIRHRDRHHPTFVASCRPDLFKFHSSFADVFAMDPYGNEEKFISWCRRAEKEVLPHKPVIAVPWADSDPALIRLQAWTAIVHGVRGIIWYCWSQTGGGPLGVGIAKKPEQQAVYKALLADIKRILPGLYNLERRSFEVGPFHCLFTGSQGGRRYLFVVNTSEKDADASFDVPELTRIKSVFRPLVQVPMKDKNGNVVKQKDGAVRLTDERIDITPGKFIREMKAGEVQVWRW